MAIFAVSFLFQLATGKSSPPTAHRGRRDAKKKRVECCGIPLKPKPGLTPISCHAVLERSACAPFIKERRMECVNATSLRRKSGQWGTQPLPSKWTVRDSGQPTQDRVLGKFQRRLVQTVGGSPRIYAGGRSALALREESRLCSRALALARLRPHLYLREKRQKRTHPLPRPGGPLRQTSAQPGRAGINPKMI